MNEPRLDVSKNSKYFLYIAIAFVVVLMISNTVGTKIIQLGSLSLAGAIFIFPISYIFGDILTEVYGYRASRKIIWSGFAAIIFMSLCYWFVKVLPAAPFWNNQEAYDLILGGVPRIVVASITAFILGEFSNSYVLSRMKVLMEGKHLWMRTIGSTIVGEGVDSILFAVIAFAGLIPGAALVSVIISGYLVKVAIEALATPITYFIVNKLKKAEGIDVYDKGISYNPFLLKE
jgi:uncharacterized integral membrane protein (TIGR00697 family)